MPTNSIHNQDFLVLCLIIAAIIGLFGPMILDCIATVFDYYCCKKRDKVTPIMPEKSAILIINPEGYPPTVGIGE